MASQYMAFIWNSNSLFIGRTDTNNNITVQNSQENRRILSYFNKSQCKIHLTR